MDSDNSFIGGYAVPVDPMDDLQCDSCQRSEEHTSELQSQ